MNLYNKIMTDSFLISETWWKVESGMVCMKFPPRFLRRIKFVKVINFITNKLSKNVWISVVYEEKFWVL